MITTSIGHDKKLSNLAKIYINNAKYSGHNNSFIFKLAIFYDIYLRADVLFKAKIKLFSTMLKDPILANYFSIININSIAINSN